MSAERRAAFLSYAFQDVEAAKKTCGALRAAGVEVWFSRFARGFEFGVHSLGLKLESEVAG